MYNYFLYFIKSFENFQKLGFFSYVKKLTLYTEKIVTQRIIEEFTELHREKNYEGKQKTNFKSINLPTGRQAQWPSVTSQCNSVK